jgi:protein gp37
MADVFERRDDLDAVRAQLYELILATPWLDWLLLTKRPENCLSMSKWDEWPDNVWLGTTVESPEYYWRIRELCKNVAPVHFISAEPLLADLASIPLAGIQWVICGGESGPNFRTMNPDWARSLRDQCTLANVAFHFKQWGGLKKKPKTGRLLDERTWDEVPCR